MYIRKRIKKRRGFFARHRILMLFLLGLSACAGTIVVRKQIKDPVRQLLSSYSAPNSTPQPNRNFEPAKSPKFIYPYSVIPGGVLSREELREKVAEDGVVAEHYAQFNVDQARVVHSEEDQFVHVAYRLKNQVYWTARKLRIPKGEPLITDGREVARTRCGNRVSAVPLQPVSEEEPAIETFDIPSTPEQPMEPVQEVNLDLREVPPMDALTPMQVPSLPEIVYFDSKRAPYRKGPLALFPRREYYDVPEPATLSLLAIGLIALFSAKLIKR